MNFWDIIKSIFATIATAVTYLLGGWDTAIIVLIVCLVLDFLLCTAVAIINKQLSSAVGFRGVVKKVAVLAIIVLAGQLDRLIGNADFLLRSFVCYFYVANEGISLVENCSLLGLPIPDKLRNALVQLRDSKKKSG